jgi:hypothetical protein
MIDIRELLHIDDDVPPFDSQEEANAVLLKMLMIAHDTARQTQLMVNELLFAARLLAFANCLIVLLVLTLH